MAFVSYIHPEYDTARFLISHYPRYPFGLHRIIGPQIETDVDPLPNILNFSAFLNQDSIIN